MCFDIKNKVDLLFKNAPDRFAEVRENPVTGGKFVANVDSMRGQKLRAQRALEARESFGAQKPDDAPELPLSYQERERLKVCGVNYIISVFGRSLACRDFLTEGHPNFDVYARGVMASELAPPFIREDAQLLLDYPPEPLTGMGPGLQWRGS